MKNTSTFILTFLFCLTFVFSYGQSKRMVVVEEATQASCPPCAVQNPPMQQLINANKDKIVFIAYQVWWPGIDPMYEDNPTEVQARVTTSGYYTTVTGAPNIIIQGSGTAGAPSTLTQNTINTISDQDAEFDLDIQAAIEGSTLTVTGTATANTDVSGDLRLRLIITEELIKNDYLAFIGTNGETEFDHVFKKFINGPAGIDLEDSWLAGEVYEINETFDLSTLNIYNYGQLEVVAMVQNDDTKFVYQGVIDSDIDFILTEENNVGAKYMKGLPPNVCSGQQEMSASFYLENTGNTELTSATIYYDVNNEDPATYEWTGSLGTFENEIIELPAITFESIQDNQLNVNVGTPNGVEDEDESDNTISSAIVPQGPESNGVYNVVLQTDSYGDELYWEIRNSAEEIIASGGNPNVGLDNIGTGAFPPPASAESYGNNTKYEIPVPIDVTDCYTIHVTDFYGDGQAGSSPVGYFRVFDENDNEIISETGSYAERINKSNGVMAVGVEDIVEINEISVYPNPAYSDAVVNFELNNQSQTTISILNSVGQQVFTKDLGLLSTGKYAENIDFSQYADGIYMIRLSINNQIVTKKITHINN